MHRTILNLSTGKESQLPLTSQEVAALQNVSQPVIVREIDARRLQLALLQLGVLEVVEAAIPPLGKAAQIEWEKSTTIRENNPLVQLIVSTLALDIETILDLANSIS